MNTGSSPLVSILTPVYNGAEYLAECIESVLAQTYPNWDYTIVNNCSTDESLSIAQNYAARDPRIRVVSNDRFLRIIENHNHTIRQISPESKYCKFVFGDDWLHPSCVQEMVRIAEQQPSVGLVGAYAMDGRSVILEGPLYPCPRISGREVCRHTLLGGGYMFGTMTSLLVRSDLIRKRTAFFNEENLHADLEACFDLLQESDFGFVHQVLTFSRPREASNGAFAKDFDSLPLGYLVSFLKYGPAFLEEAEYRKRWKALHRMYHRMLAKNILRIRPRQFWKYHQDTLAACGSGIDRFLLAISVIAELASQISHPLKAIERAQCWWSRALDRISRANGHPERRRLPRSRDPKTAGDL